MIKLSLIERWPLVISIILALALFYLNFSTYDFSTHLFFAKHYSKNWFSTIDYQLAAGLDISTYPPLLYQILTLFSFVMPLETAGYLVTFISWLFLAYFSASFFIEYLKIKKDYFWYFFAFVFLSIGLLKAIFVFGQISTVFSFAFGFISLKYFIKALNEGKKKNYLLFSLSLSLVALSHVLSFLAFSIALLILGLKEIVRIRKNIRRVSISCLIVIIVVSLGLMPLVSDVLTGSAVPSKEIPHASRYPLSSATNFNMWIYTTYGLTFASLFLPVYMLYLKIKNKKELLALYFLALFFFILSLGNNTPLTSLLFRGIGYWITYDRFSLLSSIFLALFMPAFVYYLKSESTRILLTVFLIAFIAFSITWLPSIHKAFSGVPVNYKGTDKESVVNYILNFLNNNATVGYRYQTFGVGKPIGQIYFYTNMSTLDTDYFTGRQIPWLRDSGIEEIDTARDENVLRTFMQQASNYSVKYIFTVNCIVSCDNFYHNFVKSYGWEFTDYKKFNNSDVIVWTNPDNNLKPVNTTMTAGQLISMPNYLWGTIPLVTLAIFICVTLEEKLHRHNH